MRPPPYIVAAISLVAIVACGVGTKAHAQVASSPASASGLSNLRYDTLAATDTFFFDVGSLFVATISARHIRDTSSIALRVLGTPPQQYAAIPLPANSDSIIWRYRRFDTQLRQPVFALDSTLLDRAAPLRPFDTNEGQSATSLAELQNELGAVDYRGTFGRGLRFGNSQNLVLDSRLDLQLSGDLGQGLQVAAVVSDQNIPLQPEGNTVALQEFDRLFVSVSKDAHTLTAGDYSLRSDRGRFLRFDKNLQGLAYTYQEEVTQPTETAESQSAIVNARAAVAAARGEFRRIQLPVADGNQGPYRLTGARGEAFVIVLAGTERVTLDGRALERGLDRDYVIDYNRGEITFQPRLLINRFHRILVEYEYSDREYLRSIASTEAAVAKGAWSFYAQGFQQQDGLRRTGADLSPAAEAALRLDAGGPEGILVPSAARLPEGTANPLRYIAVPALSIDACATAGDSIYVYSPTADTRTAFSIVFTEVGFGAGDYELAPEASANGAAYAYQPRGADCMPRGRFAAVRRVQAPRALRVLTLGGGFAPDSSTSITWETAASQRDDNRYSAGSSTAFAGLGQATRNWALGGGVLETSAGLEGTTDGFEAVAPWRDVEFKRLWNLGALAKKATTEPGAETLLNADVGYALRRSRAVYGIQHYRQGARYSGIRQQWEVAHTPGNWRLAHRGNNLRATRSAEATGRTELEASASHRARRYSQSVGFRTLSTQNYDAVLDAATSVNRRVSEWWLTSSQAAGDSVWTTGVAYRGRADAVSKSDDRIGFANDGLSHQVEATLSSPQGKPSALEAIATYRRTESAEGNGGPSTKPSENFYLGRLTHRYRMGREGWLRSQTSAEAGSGQERRVSLQYVRVQPGQGQYVWRDYNGDGAEDLGEFEVAVFADSAAYVRTVSLTDEFVATNTLLATQTLNVDFGRFRKTRAGQPKRSADLKPQRTLWWQRLSALSTANLRRRALQSVGYQRLLTVNLPSGDTSVVGDDLAWRSALFFNRAKDALRVELEHRQLANRSISLQGLQQLRSTEQALNLMQPIGQSLRLSAALSRERQRSRSEGLNERNYTIDEQRLAPGLSYQPSAFLRVSAEGAWRTANDLSGSNRVRAQSYELTVDASLPEANPSAALRNPLAGATLRTTIRRVDQRFEGKPDSPSGFALLEGLRPGRSWIWNATLDQQLGRALQLSLRYEGRQLGDDGRVVHSGQAQVQAVF